MEDIATLQKELKARLDEAEALKRKIQEENSRIWKQREDERRTKVEEQFGSVIAEINTKIKAAAELLSQANQLGQEAWKGSLKNNRDYFTGEDPVFDLNTIESLIDLQPITDQLYEAGVEQISY